MRNIRMNAFMVLVLILLIGTTTTSAADPSQLIGTIVHYVEQIQDYPNSINTALCENNKEEYSMKMGELANLIIAANDAIADSGLPNTLNLWAVYSAITTNPNCGVHDSSLARADWSREELDRIGYKYGLFDTPVTEMCGIVPMGISLSDAMKLTGEAGGVCESQYHPDWCKLNVDVCFVFENWGYNNDYFYDSSTRSSLIGF